MSDRLQRRFDEVRSRRGRALAFFYTAGYPRLDSTVEVGKALAAGGADILELGMPFSDPLADGPVIQNSSEVALRNGMSLKRLMEDVRRLRQEVGLPIVLMGYVNPILRYGADRFFGDAAAAGVDGLILPELPIEESERFAGDLRSAGLAQILLVTPTTPPGRVEQIDSLASGFVYCVSMTGVTGGEVMGKVGEYLGSVRKRVTRNPMMVGFGISAPGQASEMALQADGVIIGSALIRKLGALPARSEARTSSERYRELEGWVNGFRKAIDGSLS